MDDCVHYPWIVDSDAKELLRIDSESTARLSPLEKTRLTLLGALTRKRTNLINVYVDTHLKVERYLGLKLVAVRRKILLGHAKWTAKERTGVIGWCNRSWSGNLGWRF
jgi:hypothetical protein